MASIDMHSLAADLDGLKLDECATQRSGGEGEWHLVQTIVDLKAMTRQLFSSTNDSHALYLDTEGVNLSRHGSISILQVFALPCKKTFLVDVRTLGPQAFTTNTQDGKSLQDLLECEDIRKYWFDVRNDADALYALFNVRLRGVIDVQLLEVASRTGSRHVLRSLATCMEQEQALSGAALQQWQGIKSKVVDMFDPKRGGSYEVFNARPLPQMIIDYCIGDVQLLPILQAVYEARLNDAWMRKVKFETNRRLEEARSPGYKHQGRHKVFAPRTWRFPPNRNTYSRTKKTTSRLPASTTTAAQPSLSKTVPRKTVLIDSGTVGDGRLRHQTIQFVAEGSNARHKGRSRYAVRSHNPNEPPCLSLEEQNWALCDKDCGWCGHCGDGVL